VSTHLNLRGEARKNNRWRHQSVRLSESKADAKLRSLDVRIRTQVSEYERLVLTFSRLTV